MIQSTGSNFKLNTLLKARNQALEVLENTIQQCKVGMTEEDVSLILDQEFAKQEGFERKWHPNKVRFNQNTLLSFREQSRPTRLKDDSLFFLDIGPVFHGHEADIGRTFSLSNKHEHIQLIKASEEVFKLTAQAWKENGLSGHRLYERATQITEQLGYKLNLKMAGHRIGDFPHALFHKGSLKNFQEKPLENIWVLEILIKHSSKPIGAFYEDILF